MRWTYTPPSAEEVEAFSQNAKFSRVMAELLLRNGHRDPVLAETFLEPTLASLGDPFILPNLEAAASRLRQAVLGNEAVVVLGDYDVDGVSSTTLLVGILRRFGLSPRFVVPRRAEDGYGLSRSAIDRALEGGKPQLFVVLDCGTNSLDEVAYLIEQNIDVVVVDHHRSKEGTLKQGILVNPHVDGETGAVQEELRNLCTVGLVFKLAHGLIKQLRQENHPVALDIKLRDELDLVALGTVADLVPLLGENRTLAKHGLRILQNTSRPGLKALMSVAGVREGQDITPVDISFRLGPRINASGRLADATLSVELMLSADARFSAETARQLNEFNRERQDIERLITEDADRMIESSYADDQGIVLYSEDWHPGVVGIVAGRVSRKYNRPCIVLGNDGELAKGSGRSVNRINLVEVLATCSEHLDSWGGHPMAVGVAVKKEHLAAFRIRFAEAVREYAGSDIAEAELEIAAWLSPDMIGEALMMELDALHPFGQGNPEPVFGIRGVVFRQSPDVFKDLHFRFWFDGDNGRRLHGVAWKMADRVPPAREPVDLAVKLTWNHFNGRKLLQLELIDWRPSTKS
jgi:single-stranded-DNA-specific exonuclease|uniref:single-stranded-DNA-specific exonuclease RecJ n=1 Tax=Cephaloticoccus sp. TaxID=1985742 RepID=UPI004049D810